MVRFSQISHYVRAVVLSLPYLVDWKENVLFKLIRIELASKILREKVKVSETKV